MELKNKTQKKINYFGQQQQKNSAKFFANTYFLTIYKRKHKTNMNKIDRDWTFNWETKNDEATNIQTDDYVLIENCRVSTNSLWEYLWALEHENMNCNQTHRIKRETKKLQRIFSSFQCKLDVKGFSVFKRYMYRKGKERMEMEWYDCC